MLYAIAFRNMETGHISYYTGKAGGDWLSPNAENAFFAYRLEGVQYLGGKMLAQHNITLSNHELIPVIDPRPEKTIAVDGCDYTVETRCDDDIIEVYDCRNRLVATAERDHAVESLMYSYITDEEGVIEDGSQRDLFDKPAAEIAAWLVSTHPCQ